jgi:hypothetical protein
MDGGGGRERQRRGEARESRTGTGARGESGQGDAIEQTSARLKMW